MQKRALTTGDTMVASQAEMRLDGSLQVAKAYKGDLYVNLLQKNVLLVMNLFPKQNIPV